MNNLHHLHHRQAFGHRAREPQSGFSPTAIFDLPLPSIITDDLATIVVDGVTELVPSGFLGSATSSTKVSSSTKSLPTSTTSTSATPTSTSHSTTTSSTSSTSTSQTVTSTTPVPQVIPAPPHTRTSLVEQTISTTANRRPTTTSTAVPSNGLSSGAVAGGIAAAIIAVVALIVVVVFFLRRSRKRDDEITDFNPHVFRRSAILISDPPTHEDTIAHGFNPRPPTMIEKRLAPTFGTQYNAPPPPPPPYNHGKERSDGYPEKHAEFGSHPQQLTPGQVVNMNYGAPPSNSNHPMFAPAIHNQSPFSSVYGPISPHHDQHNLARQPPMGVNVNGDPSRGGATYPVLTRQPSANSSADGHSGQVPPSLALQKENGPANDYVDLDRSSVSPYQAAQYVEISRRLNTDVPQGLQVQDADEKNLPPLPPKSGEISPFADPDSESTPSSPGAQFAINRRNPSPRPKSGDTILSATLNTLDFPLPPSPAYTVSSRYRIDSTPPTLPEINVESRGSTTRYSGLRNAVTIPSEPGSSDGLNVTNQRPPTISSPLASSPRIPLTQDVEETPFTDAVLAAHSSVSSSASPAAPAVPVEAKKRITTYSVYDPEDAYGGI